MAMPHARLSRLPTRLIAPSTFSLTGTGIPPNTSGPTTIGVSTPQPYVAVEPGESVDVPIVIANNNSTASSTLTFVLTRTIDAYTFEQRSEPECGPIGPSATFTDWTEFPYLENQQDVISVQRGPKPGGVGGAYRAFG